MSQENAKYTSYQNMVAQVNTGMVQMEKLAASMDLEENRKALEKSREKLTSHKFAVGILGEFKRGKSTVINSLLEKEIMPADILPTSATMNRVTYDLTPHVELLMRDGSTKEIGIGELPAYVTKLSEEYEAQAAQVEEAIVYYPCKFCQNGVDIVDTPGLNDDERMNRITEEVIPKLDAVIMVVTPDNPFSMSEADFVRNKLMTSDLSRLIFLVNKIDLIRREKDRERLVQEIKSKIQKSVMNKMAELYGEDSQEYRDAQLKVGKIRVYPFSALDALDGKMEGDKELIEKSGTIPFEEALTKMLTEDRGALELGGPLNVLDRTALEVAKTAETRKNALQLSGEEFASRQREMLAQINDMRRQKTEEKKRLHAKAVHTKNELESEVRRFYPELKTRLEEKLEQTEVDPATLKNEAGRSAAAAALQKAVSDEMKSALAIFTEKMEAKLKTIVGEEAMRLGEFTEKMSSQLDGFRRDFASDKGLDTTNLMAIGVDVLTDFMGLYGIAGIVSGYREAGIKGAVAGGGVGLVANLAAASLLASMSIVGLPMLVISCAVGSVVSKKFAGFLFAKDVGQRKLNELRAQLRKNLEEVLDDMESGRELENWVCQRVEQSFDELTACMEDECEKMLKDTESTMDAIKKDLVQNEVQRKKLAEEYDESLVSVKQILENLKPIHDRVRRVLAEA